MGKEVASLNLGFLVVILVLSRSALPKIEVARLMPLLSYKIAGEQGGQKRMHTGK